MLKNPDIDLGTKYALWIGGSIYCMTPSSLSSVTRTLTDLGYWFKDARQDSSLLTRFTPDEIEDMVLPMWAAELPVSRFAKCSSCLAYLSPDGSRTHDSTCDHCGATLFLKVHDGTEVRFCFRSADDRLPREILMVAHHVDVEEGYLYLHDKFYDNGKYGASAGEAVALFDDHQGLWSFSSNGSPRLGQRLYKIRFTGDLARGESSPDDPIEIRSLQGQYVNFKLIQVQGGVEYDDAEENLPRPAMIHIYEAWRWAPLQPAPDLNVWVMQAGGLMPRVSYFHEGETVLTPESLAEMGKFIRHLTTLNPDEWDVLSQTWPTKGTAAILAVSYFCHPNPVLHP